MASSGTYAFDLTNADIIVEAFDRCEIRGSALTRNHVMSARRSLNLALVELSNRGINLWAVKPFTIQLVVGQATYVAGSGVTNISANTVSMLDVYYTIINGNGAGVNTDRIMLPISETEYAQLPNKAMVGAPTTYWYQKKMPGSQQITFWQVPDQGYPTTQVSGYYLSRLQDAAPVNGQTPDVPYLGLDMLCANMALRLAEKFAKDKYDALKAAYREALELFLDTDREDVPITILPATGSWFGRGV